MKDLAIGISGFTRAFGFAMRNGLWWMFLMPVVLWLLFAGGIAWVSAGAVDAVSGWFPDPVGSVFLPPTERAWWAHGMMW